MCGLLISIIKIKIPRCSRNKHKLETGGMKPNLTYFHPTMEPHPTQNMSTTVCIPVIIIRSSFSPTVTFTLPCILEQTINFIMNETGKVKRKYLSLRHLVKGVKRIAFSIFSKDGFKIHFAGVGIKSKSSSGKFRGKQISQLQHSLRYYIIQIGRKTEVVGVNTLLPTTSRVDFMANILLLIRILMKYKQLEYEVIY